MSKTRRLCKCKTRISNDLEIHPFLIQRVLDCLEKTAVESLKERGVSRMGIFSARLRIRHARSEGGKRVCGRDVKLRAKPERKTLRMTATKNFRQKLI